ncbi:uncharacterized protein DEA37_0000145 [Paragonimus westermani]|uniref:Trichohyalin-plectin-homology domain-containing protein n=2 Tax=Paragonimus westermani TaxID=34504 RepID=A0A5J4NM44_9TREM|nr:uncharacterized protein DEA37_0000145 [Paragonimus westermani]
MKRTTQKAYSSKHLLPPSPEANDPNYFYGGVKNNFGQCDHIRSVKVLSQDEWKRLNSQLQRDSIEQARLEEKRLESEKIKQQSHEMVKHWTNTFLGARQKKLDERAKRLANEEATKVAIDMEEAKFQAEQRKTAIEEAKLKLYYQTDRVKTFHSALTLTEVLKERDAQLELKELCKKLGESKDKAYVEHWKKELEEATLKEQEKLKKQREKNLEMAEHLKEQMKLRQEAQKLEENLRIAEGQLLRQTATEDQLELERLSQIDREHASRLMKDYMSQMEGNKQIKKIERLKEEEEDEKCRLFAAAKRKMTTLRVLKEREMFKAREEQMEKVRNYLAEQMKAKREDEDERIRRTVAEREEAERLKEAEKAKAQAKQIAEIEAYRLETIQRHRQEQEAAKLNELEEVRARNEAERALAEYEAACYANRFNKNKALSSEYMEQTRKRAEDEKAERARNILMVGNGNKLAVQEERTFQDYTRRVIDHCKVNGRNVYPLEVAARPTALLGLSASLPGETSVLEVGNSDADKQQQNNHNSNGLEIESVSNGENQETKQRLGFVW